MINAMALLIQRRVATFVLAGALLAGLAVGAGLVENGRSAGAERHVASEVSPAVPQANVAPAAAQARTITYAYDSAGRLTGANYGASSIAYTYDKGGNLLTREVTQAGAAHKVYLPITQRNDQGGP